MAVGTEAVEVILMGTMITLEATQTVTPAMTTPKATPTGMKTLGLDVDDYSATLLLSLLSLACQISIVDSSSSSEKSSKCLVDLSCLTVRFTI